MRPVGGACGRCPNQRRVVNLRFAPQHALCAQSWLDSCAHLSDSCPQEAPDTATHAKTGFEEAAAAFLDYLASYRRYPQHTVKAYARDVRSFREFLAGRYNPCCPQTHPVAKAPSRWFHGSSTPHRLRHHFGLTSATAGVPA